jgi:hypothetical protein
MLLLWGQRGGLTERVPARALASGEEEFQTASGSSVTGCRGDPVSLGCQRHGRVEIAREDPKVREVNQGQRQHVESTAIARNLGMVYCQQTPGFVMEKVRRRAHRE